MIDERTVVIVCATDERYMLPLAVMLRSAMDNLAPDRSAEVHILNSGLTTNQRDKVALGLSSERCTIHWVEARATEVAGVPVWGRMPISTYYKLLVARLLPERVSRAVWLDCDLLVARDLGELWDVDLETAPAAAVQDGLVPTVSSRGGIATWEALGIARDSRYFNAGVMLMDLDVWRRTRVSEKALDYLRQSWKSVVFWDQEGLNVVLCERWKALPNHWNQNVGLPRRSVRGSAHLQPAILHFAGMLKPWLYRTRDPEWQLYMNYLDKTAWAGTRPPRDAASRAISLYERSGVRLVLHPLENLAIALLRKISINRVAFQSPPPTVDPHYKAKVRQ